MRYKYYTDNKTVVVAISTYAGKPVRGVAKCSAEDEFDFQKGATLAKLRCDLKIADKRVNRAAKKLEEAKKAYLRANKLVDDTHDYLTDAQFEYARVYDNLKDIINEM